MRIKKTESGKIIHIVGGELFSQIIVEKKGGKSFTTILRTGDFHTVPTDECERVVGRKVTLSEWLGEDPTMKAVGEPFMALPPGTPMRLSEEALGRKIASELVREFTPLEEHRVLYPEE